MTDKSEDTYRFVPVGDDRRRQQPVGHHVYADGLHTGRLVCQLTTKSPLFVGQPTDQRSMNRHGVPIIPGSSLKGVIRSVAEAVSDSCLTLYREPPARGWNYRIPPDAEPCSDVKRLCICCRLFGTTGEGEGNAFMGKVAISEAIGPKDAWGESLRLPQLWGPRPTQARKRYTEQGTIKGRKFYRHRLAGVDTRGQRPQSPITPVAPEKIFDFSVHFVNLTDEELVLVLYGLVLEDGLGHHVGYAKPLGLGSAVINISEIELVDSGQRYQQLGGGIGLLKGEALAAFVSEHIRPYVRDQSKRSKALREVLALADNPEMRYAPPPRPRG